MRIFFDKVARFKKSVTKIGKFMKYLLPPLRKSVDRERELKPCMLIIE
jgi:hypothetical protein